jgi:hypothetical protein
VLSKPSADSFAVGRRQKCMWTMDHICTLRRKKDRYVSFVTAM